MDEPSGGNSSRHKWTQILVPGEVNSHPAADRASKARLDLARCAREVFSAQPTRHFVLGFSLCGSFMRVWVFDPLGGIASEQFDINKDGLRFVSTMLGFFWMSGEQFGFDPTVGITANGQRFIEIKRDGRVERLILDKLITPARCIAGRATACWRAYREDPYTPVVVKDSWQDPERGEEGDLLLEATGKGVVCVARHYHHETVQVRGMDDDRQNIRRGLDVTEAANYRLPIRSRRSPSTSAPDTSRADQSIGGAGTKRPSTKIDAASPPCKRPCPTSPTIASSSTLQNKVLHNRVHRRVILSSYGIPIYHASSRNVLLTTLCDCIEGHRSLREKADLLHRDILLGNIMVDKNYRGFLIDLDIATKEQQIGVSGATGKFGTPLFMSIRALLGEQPHSFMDDLESFFWVLF